MSTSPRDFILTDGHCCLKRMTDRSEQCLDAILQRAALHMALGIIHDVTRLQQTDNICNYRAGMVVETNTSIHKSL
jgi:hypothetical protein